MELVKKEYTCCGIQIKLHQIHVLELSQSIQSCSRCMCEHTLRLTALLHIPLIKAVQPEKYLRLTVHSLYMPAPTFRARSRTLSGLVTPSA